MGSGSAHRQMSVHFISGKPGGGKTLYAVRMIVDELVKGHRCVVTNVAIKPGALNEYLQREYPERLVDLLNRLVILDDDTTGAFWSHRGPGSSGPRVLTADEWRAGVKPDYSGVKDSGVLYVIDEVHNFFNARAWMDTGKDVLFYLSQHRKLGDTVIAITQAIGNVDKQFRSVTQDYTYLRNMCKERYGYFKLPALFMRQTYLSPATDTSVPMESGTFRLDVSGLASCYDTAVGVGIHGRVGDVGERTKGIPWWVGVGLVILGVSTIAWGVPKGIGAMFKTALPATQAVGSNVVGQVAAVQPVEEKRLVGSLKTGEVSPTNATRLAVQHRPGEVNPDLYLVKYFRFVDQVEWTLSDGRIVLPSDLDFMRGNFDQVELRGLGVIKRRRAVSGVYTSAAPIGGSSDTRRH